jgi:hypothetical protein
MHNNPHSQRMATVSNPHPKPQIRLRKPDTYVGNVDYQPAARHWNGTADVVTSHGGSAKRNVIGCPSANQNY